MRLKPGTLAMTFLLAGMSSLGPLSTDIYVASLPHIGEALQASTARVQLTITCYLMGFAAGQVIYGPLSDKLGRRPLLLGGCALYVAASALCVFAQSIEPLIAGRIAQALGAAGPIILSRAVVRDLYEGRGAARQFALMSSIMGVTPIIAPIAGGILQEYYGWRASFVVMATFGIVLAFLAALLMPETNSHKQAEPLSLANVWASYAIVLKNKAYRSYLGIQACSYNALFAFISSSSHIMQRVYGLSPSQFGWTFGACSASFVAGALVGSRLVARFGIDGLIGIGAGCMLGGGVMLCAALALFPESFLSVVIPYMVSFVGVGFLLPQTQAAALTPFPERAGAASSLIGFAQMMSGALVGTILGAVLGASAWPLAIVSLIAGGLAFVIFRLSADARRQYAPITRSFL